MTSVTVRVMSYDTGDVLGRISMPTEEWDQYAAESHPAFQWPGGLVRAGDWLGDRLGDDELDSMGITARTTIWLD